MRGNISGLTDKEISEFKRGLKEGKEDAFDHIEYCLEQITPNTFTKSLLIAYIKNIGEDFTDLS